MIHGMKLLFVVFLSLAFFWGCSDVKVHEEGGGGGGGETLLCEINVQGNGNDIADGSANPTATNGTDFGSCPTGQNTQVTYTIQNTGSAPLTITAAITLSGPDAASFSVSQPNSTTIAPGSSETFEVTCNPGTTGAKTASVNIPNDDANENPYNFNIKGTAVCPAISGGTCCEWIERVQFGSIDNDQAGIENNGQGYENYANLSTNVTQGSAVPITVYVNTDGTTYPEFVKIWVDWNGDSDFTDPGEEYDLGGKSVPGTATPFNANITVPNDASLGTRAMRIIMKYASAPPGPCDDPGWGEVEDYSVNVVASRGSADVLFTLESQGGVPRRGHTSVVHDDKLWLIGEGEVQFSRNGADWTEVPSNLVKRTEHACASYAGRLWLFGGRDNYGFYNDVWHSQDGRQWTQAASSAPWKARYGHTVVVYKNRMWLLGGQGDGWFCDVWNTQDGVQWEHVTTDAPWTRRFMHTAVTYKDKMWVLGGYDGKFLSDVWSSNDGLDWIQQSAISWPARSYHTTVATPKGMWVIGGLGQKVERGRSPGLDDVWHSTDGSRWTKLAEHCPWSNRFMHSSAFFKGKIWVIGGESGKDQFDSWSHSLESSRANTDFDGSGTPDLLVWQEKANRAQLWKTNAMGQVIARPLLTQIADLGYEIKAVTDFDGDSKADILWHNPAKGENHIWYMNGEILTSNVWFDKSSPAYDLAVVGRFNADNHVDLLWRNTATGDCEVWLLDRGRVRAKIALPKVMGNYQARVAFDYDHDGHEDILWQDRESGELHVWSMHNGQLKSVNALCTLPHPQVDVVFACDFNHDGWVDLLCNDSISQANHILYLKEGSVLKVASLDSLDSDFQLVSVADYDRDQSPDLVFFDRIDGGVYLHSLKRTNAQFLGSAPRIFGLTKTHVAERPGDSGERRLFYHQPSVLTTFEARQVMPMLETSRRMAESGVSPKMRLILPKPQKNRRSK